MKKAIQQKFSLKRTNVKTFLFFLGFTSLLWLFTQFSKKYTQEVAVRIEYTNIPTDRLLDAASDDTIRMTLHGNGFRLMTYQWTSPALVFDMQKASRVREPNYFFGLDQKDQLLLNKLNFDGKILAIEKDTLWAHVDTKLEKKVKVRLQSTLTYAAGYGSDYGVVLSEDSVRVSGPKRIVDTLQFVTTEILQLEELNANQDTELALEKSTLPDGVVLQRDKVYARIEVSKFTEGSQEIPITLINVPADKEVKIFPKVVTVVYRVALQRYHEITPRDFRVIADYKKGSENSAYLILELKDQPTAIHDVRLQEKQVQFIIVDRLQQE